MISNNSENQTILAEQVREFLKENPDFFGDLTPPERNLGGGVLDFQHYMLKHLQKDKNDLKSRYDLLVDFCRENMSVQAQVHKAVLRLIRARTLEQLLEAITMDLVSLFDVDVVRLGMESDIPMNTSYGEQNYSGFVFIPPGMVDLALGEQKNILLIDDCKAGSLAGLEDIFSDCEEMIRSCALLRLELDTVGKNVLLAFGVRHAGRFHPGQGVELLQFLAQIVAHQMDMYLQDLTI